ncbi:MAG: tetratricopeptide repeat protein [Bacteroidales bacterium]
MTKKAIIRPSKKTFNPVNTGSDLRNIFFWQAAILVITFIVFIPSLKNQFITFDDHQYVVENQFIKGLTSDNLKAIFTTDANNLGNYHPVTLMSYTLNHAISGLEPTSYHLMNILLHLVNTLLVFQVILLILARVAPEHKLLLSSMAALLFGIHPLHVESVAWVAARKDLLYTCFYLLSIISYIRYLDKRSTKNYLLSLLFFLLSLLSKGMAVTLPLILVAVDYLFRRKLTDKRVILEKIPFFMLSIGFGVLAIVVQQAQGATEIIRFQFTDRVVFAAFGLTQYLVKMVFPYELCGYYPYPDLEIPAIPWTYYLSLIPAVALIVVLIYMVFVRGNRTVTFGILFFLINVMFVLQLFPVGSAVMADRYTYLASIGLFFLLAAGVGLLLRKLPSSRTVTTGVFLSYAAVLSIISYQRCTVWHDSYSFWSDVAAKYPAFYPAINNLGDLKEKQGETQEALRLYSASILVGKKNPDAYFHRGSIYGKSGHFREAIADFDEAIRYSPGFTQAFVNRAIAKIMNNDRMGALADLDLAISRGGNQDAYFNRGVLKNELADYPGAISDIREAINLDPSCGKCYYSLGLANYNAKFYDEAITSFSTCISMNPSSGNAYYYRGLARYESGNPDSCCSDLKKAYSLGISEAKPIIDQHCR